MITVDSVYDRSVDKKVLRGVPINLAEKWAKKLTRRFIQLEANEDYSATQRWYGKWKERIAGNG